MSNAARLVTSEELERFPRDDRRHELVQGRVVRMTPVGYQHSRVVARLMTRLGAHLESHGEPGLAVTELGFKLASNPDTVRAPDIAFVRHDRVPSPRHRGFLSGPPDLAIEVLSPDDRLRHVQEKVGEYLACGVRLVIVIDPDAETATVFRPSAAPVVLREADALDLDEVVPGFRCPVVEIFA